MMVAWGGIEPPTQGFSIPKNNYLTALIVVVRINKNQQLTRFWLDIKLVSTLIYIPQNGAKMATQWLHSGYTD